MFSFFSISLSQLSFVLFLLPLLFFWLPLLFFFQNGQPVQRGMLGCPVYSRVTEGMGLRMEAWTMNLTHRDRGGHAHWTVPKAAWFWLFLRLVDMSEAARDYIPNCHSKSSVSSTVKPSLTLWAQEDGPDLRQQHWPGDFGTAKVRGRQSSKGFFREQRGHIVWEMAGMHKRK